MNKLIIIFQLILLILNLFNCQVFDDKKHCFTRQGIFGTCVRNRSQCKSIGNLRETKCNDNTICCPYVQIGNTNNNKDYECGMRPKIGAIVGGFESEPNSWPWAVAIYERTSFGPQFICGGTLIDDEYIVTAAHCFVRPGVSPNPNRFLIKTATHMLSSQKYYNEIQRIIPHEKYQSHVRYNDIALVKLKNTIEFNPTLAPICLPEQSFKRYNFTGKMCKLIGWGSKHFGGKISDTLQEVDVPVVSNKVCNDNYLGLGDEDSLPYGINESFICAGFKKGGKDSCQGDSGGPLAIKINDKWTLIGIVSFGYKCAEPGYPGVYTRVTTFLDWISAHRK